MNGCGFVAENRYQNSALWFYNTYVAPNLGEARVYVDEAIRQRQAPQPETTVLPSLLKAARSLEQQSLYAWQSRELVFLKQAKLLVNYEDDCPCSHASARYYPTYQSLTDAELRGYFTWRTQLRKGDLQKAPSTFAFLYIYEILNQVGVENPAEGYEKLRRFRAEYVPLDNTVERYLDTWMSDYVLYYDLPESLLQESKPASFDRQLVTLAEIDRHTDAEIAEAVRSLAPRWLGRSRFYAQNTQDMDRVLARVLRGISAHYDARCKRTMVEFFFGPRHCQAFQPFESAVFVNKVPQRDRDVSVSPLRVCHCRQGHWTAEGYSLCTLPSGKLESFTKAVDCAMRDACGDRHPVKQTMDTKWILKLIDTEIQTLLGEKKQAEQKKLRLDFGKLDAIRKNADITREKLIVDEDEAPLPVILPVEAPAVPAAPLPEVPGCPLNGQELRFLRCLLTGEPTDWLRQEGGLPAVLADSINEKLYDTFADTVLTVEDCPTVIEDYADELKEMVSL